MFSKGLFIYLKASVTWRNAGEAVSQIKVRDCTNFNQNTVTKATILCLAQNTLGNW